MTIRGAGARVVPWVGRMLVAGQLFACSGADPQNDAAAESGGRAGTLPAAGAAAGSGGARAGQAGRTCSLPPAAVSGGAGAPARAGEPDSDAGMDDSDAGPTAVPRREPDPKITFDWKETAPGVNRCEAGRYVGEFKCDLVLSDGSGTAVITGPVGLTLSKSKNGEFLEIADGHIEGYALLIFNFRAGLTGRLECSTRHLEAMPIDGMVGLGDAALLPVFGFNGQLAGDLDVAGNMISGTWSFPVTTPTGMLGVCTGPWTATRM